MRTIGAFFLACSLPVLADAQAIEQVLVETYHVSERGNGEAPLTTYRIFLDLAPGYDLQMVYGDERHPLWIRTSTTFFNDTVDGVTFADRLNADRLGRYPLALDSWLTLGAASRAHNGVPVANDPDGSILTCPPYGPETGGLVPSPRKPLCFADGLRADTAIREVVTFLLDPRCFDRGGNELRTSNGAWAVLGGFRSPDPENRVLVAQVTTTGMLSFHLNVQVATSARIPMKYVASDPAEGEIAFPGLSFGDTDDRKASPY
ncbi:MAG: hypothetical protein JST66_11170 [Bacteroidetes bacterium]|nr:hypothetical protein [Bacteroidota bacterium]